MSKHEEDAALTLLSAAAVRRAGVRMLDDGLAGRMAHWRVDLDRLPAVADLVAEITRERYPDLDVPVHSRWRHFEVAGVDRWAVASATMPAFERIHAAYDLAIVSVLLDAGSGGVWRYRDHETGGDLMASEGLAVASFDLLASGRLSTTGASWRADADRLADLTHLEFAAAFQVSRENPLAGLPGRVALLNALGRRCGKRPDLFSVGDDRRPGGLFERVRRMAVHGSVAATDLLAVVLDAFGPIWPGRLTSAGVDLGDAWSYGPWSRVDDPLAGVVPFHKLSQWMTYSLIEPTVAAGVAVTGVDELTGLAEYRNGGLFVDCGVLTPRDPTALDASHLVGDPLVVEWRALTVALLDKVAPMVRERLGVTSRTFPLARMLEGGTWAAGRRVARRLRPDGAPPVRIVSDGMTF